MVSNICYLTLSVLFFLWSPDSLAQNQNFQSFSLKEVRRIHVNSEVIQLQILGESRGDKISISSSRQFPGNKSIVAKEGDLAMEVSGDELRVFHNSQLEKEDIQKRLLDPRTHSPLFIIKISGPPIPIRIDSKWGQISVQRWNSGLEIVNQNGKILVTDTESLDARIMLMNGDVTVSQSKGKLNLETYTANSTVQGFDGQLVVNSFSGNHKVLKSNGHFNFQQSLGRLELNDNQSDVDFKIGAASLFVDKLMGDLRGQSQSGPLKVYLSPDLNLRVNSVEAPIALFSNQMALNVNLGSKKGDISAPNYLKTQQWSQLKTVSGQLRGSSGKGLIFVRTDSGSIQLR